MVMVMVSLSHTNGDTSFKASQMMKNPFNVSTRPNTTSSCSFTIGLLIIPEPKHIIEVTPSPLKKHR